MDLEYLLQIGIKAALEAGKIIQNFAKDSILIEKKEGGNTLASQVVTSVDFECEKVIISHLKPTCEVFNIGFLSEESEDNKSRFEKDFFWCIDPMDGTLAFINKYPGFSVSIALVAKHGTSQIGIVYNPSLNNLYTAITGKGAFKNGKPWKLNAPKHQLSYITDKKLAETTNKTKIQELIQQKIVENNAPNFIEISGSGAVLNAILVAENAPALFIKMPKKENGGGSIWDFAATACIFKELGLKATRFNGEQLDLNPKETTFMNTQGVFFST